ncbi:MerR family transcriptional regulator [Kitasatospora sp. GP82]|uniref:MerR family transcriptional regulator n=1 Tax=Kitasatospora sp. GP82 TaxID=3035089 RepID=UPI0024747A78|nr:MerR family transcriptional regulator [Kitasatospora sp. GP82]MDH6126752.1 DNA-binding transcriptional MerR regulator [Kitasatospora sp. GP82]
MDELLTGPQAAALCKVDTATIRQWKRRGKLAPAGLDEKGRPMYRRLDIALAERSTRERAGRTYG